MRHKRSIPNRSFRVADQIQRDVAQLIRELKDPQQTRTREGDEVNFVLPGSTKEKVIFWQIISIILWGTAFGLLAHLGVDLVLGS